MKKNNVTYHGFFVLLAFEVDNLDDAAGMLDMKGIKHEDLRVDEYTSKRFLFFQDPDGLLIEFYEY